MASAGSSYGVIRRVQHSVLPRTGLRMFGDDDLTSWLADEGYDEIIRERHGVAQYVSGTRC